MKKLVTACAVAMVAAACGGAQPEPQTTASTPADPTAAPSTFSAQVERGQKLYGQSCAGCHGASGEGGKAPRVVGLDKGALPLDPPPGTKARKTQFKTAADVADFVVKNMPPGGDADLKESDYWAILAFDLHANGVDLPQPLGPSNAKDVVLHK